MRQFRTQAIVIGRTEYGEADRIMTFLTPDHGKVKAIAKGVRKTKSKLAGGIEFFSVSDISFIPGRREIGTVISTRLIKHYGHIVKDLDRTNTAFALIKRLNKATEDAPETAYFDLLQQAFGALDDFSTDLTLIDIWFSAQLLRLAGHTPNLRTEKSGEKLTADKKYDFDFDAMAFYPGTEFNSDHIKFLRLLFSHNKSDALQKIVNVSKLANQCRMLVEALSNLHRG
jgi:DNA repair protein RecO (recombination protein O)